MKPPEFNRTAECTYKFDGREYHIHVDERGEVIVDVYLTSEERYQVVLASHDSFKDLSLFFTFDVGETWTGIIDDTITRLRRLVAS